jgi:hypothetical protein
MGQLGAMGRSQRHCRALTSYFARTFQTRKLAELETPGPGWLELRERVAGWKEFPEKSLKVEKTDVECTLGIPAWSTTKHSSPSSLWSPSGMCGGSS